MMMRAYRNWTFAGLAALLALAPGLGPTYAAIDRALATAWEKGHENRTRLSAGRVAAAGTSDTGESLVFFELEMTHGWKTYWRNPGDAGGIPPEFEFAGSRNLGSATVLYPVPSLLSDRAGDVIGYKDRVIFPIRISPETQGQPIHLEVTVSFGICEKLCVPVEAKHVLEVPPGPLPPASAEAEGAFAAVPRPVASARPGDPYDPVIEIDRSATAPKLQISVHVPGNPEAAAVFLYEPSGLYVPMPRRAGTDAAGRLGFEVDLANDVDLEALKGKPLVATFKGAQGQSETTFKID